MKHADEYNENLLALNLIANLRLKLPHTKDGDTGAVILGSAWLHLAGEHRFRGLSGIEEENHKCERITLEDGVVSVPDSIKELFESGDGAATKYRCLQCGRSFWINWPE